MIGRTITDQSLYLTKWRVSVRNVDAASKLLVAVAKDPPSRALESLRALRHILDAVELDLVRELQSLQSKRFRSTGEEVRLQSKLHDTAGPEAETPGQRSEAGRAISQHFRSTGEHASAIRPVESRELAEGEPRTEDDKAALSAPTTRRSRRKEAATGKASANKRPKRDPPPPADDPEGGG